MDFRKLLLRGQAVVILLAVVTGGMAVVALQSNSIRVELAYRDVLEDLELLDRVRAGSRDLAESARLYLAEPSDERRAQLGDLQRELDPYVDRLALRARLHVEELLPIDQDADAFIGWLSRAAAEPAPTAGGETELIARCGALEARLDSFARVARARGEELLDSASAFARRAQIGILITTTIGVVIGWVLAMNFLRQLATQLRRLRSAANLANQAATSRKDMLEIVSHDLRVPSNAIGLSASLLNDTRPRANERIHVDRIANAAGRMERLLDDLADVTRMESGHIELHYERCNTRSLMETCIDMFFARAKTQKVRLRTDSKDILSVRADRERLIQVLSNLIGYALSFAEADGMITISAAPATGSSGVRFAVTDSGLGLPDECAHLFERHWQGRERRSNEGFGLGLYICKKLVEAHHGEIGVECEIGKGSTFWFVIPD